MSETIPNDRSTVFIPPLHCWLDRRLEHGQHCTGGNAIHIVSSQSNLARPTPQLSPRAAHTLSAGVIYLLQLTFCTNLPLSISFYLIKVCSAVRRAMDVGCAQAFNATT